MYEVLIKQQIVNSVVLLFVLLTSFLLILNFIKAFKNKEESWLTEDGPNLLGVLRVGQIAVAIIMFLIGIININVIATGFINPEYGAIKDIIHFIKVQ